MVHHRAFTICTLTRLMIDGQVTSPTLTMQSSQPHIGSFGQFTYMKVAKSSDAYSAMNQMSDQWILSMPLDWHSVQYSDTSTNASNAIRGRCWHCLEHFHQLILSTALGTLEEAATEHPPSVKKI